MLWWKQKFSFLRNDAGFTMVETVLSITVISFISLSMSYLMSTGIDSFELISARKESLSNAQLAVNRITRELILVEPADILSISPTNLQFRDTNDVVTDFHSEVAGSLFSIFRGTSLLAENITGFIFRYFDAAGNEVLVFDDPAPVRRIQVELTVKADSNHGTVAVRGEFYPRNFMYSNFQ